MPTLNLKPTPKPIKSYYAAIDKFAQIGVTHETAVRAAFQDLLQLYARQCGWTLVVEFAISTRRDIRKLVTASVECLNPYLLILSHSCKWQGRY